MELAIVNLKLSGQTHNTVIKTDVTPAQLAIYAYMHGEDCVASLNVTSIDTKRTVLDEMNRLRAMFTSDHSSKVLNQIFPGIHPQLPTTFRAIGYDPEMLNDSNMTTMQVKQISPQSGAGKTIQEKIREGAVERMKEAGNVPPVSKNDLADALDNTGGHFDDDDLDEDETEFDDDPIDLEIAREKQLKLPPKPAA